jgi:hypothetical protein
VTSGLLDRTADIVRDSRTAGVAARGGLLARAGFYLLLATFAIRLLLMDSRPQVNASGALRTVARAPLGRGLIGLAALGFVAFGVSRLLGAFRDRDAGLRSRVTTGLQGLFYVCLTEVPASFVLGSSSTGSEQSQRSTTSSVLGLPGGRLLLLAAGVVFVGVCVWQVVTALRTGFDDSMRTRDAPAWVQLLVRVSGRVGITFRALVFLPVGVFLIVSAASSDPRRAKGLDATLAGLSRHAWGRGLLVLVAAGFVVFAVYSLLEARYRDVDAGD